MSLRLSTRKRKAAATKIVSLAKRSSLLALLLAFALSLGLAGCSDGGSASERTPGNEQTEDSSNTGDAPDDSDGGETGESEPTTTKFKVSVVDGKYKFESKEELNPALQLTAGETYIFEIDAPGHPLNINTANATGTSNRYDDQSITNNGTHDGTITFNVPADFSGSLHYNCQFHSTMNGAITVN